MERPKTLSAAFVKTVKEPGRYGDGRGGFGLSLLVKPMTSTGRLSKTFAQRLRIDGQIVNIGIGSFPVVSLAEARAAAFENRRTLAKGFDPRNSAASMPTFAETADKVIALHAESWRDNGKSEKQWRASLRTYAFPTIGNKPVGSITSADVLDVLTPIWNTKRETARRVRQRIGQVMKYAIASGLRPDNPAGDALGAALPSNGIATKHQPALPHAEVAQALAKVRESGAGQSAKKALTFLILTAARSGEVRGARWDEIDIRSRTWTIPGSRTKTGREHRVPLSDAATALLVTATPLSDGSGLIFPSVSRRGKQLSDRTLSKLIRELGLQCVVHGFRSSFRDWCADTGQRRELAEVALGHTVGNSTEQAYMRSDLFEGRRELMEAWSKYVGG